MSRWRPARNLVLREDPMVELVCDCGEVVAFHPGGIRPRYPRCQHCGRGWRAVIETKEPPDAQA